MRLSAFRAKNEVVEFVFADALLVIGGVLLGSDGAGLLGSAIGVGGVVGGLFLGMRVLGSFSAGLSEARGQIDGALASLRGADLAARHALRLLKKQRREVEALTAKMGEAERKLETAKGDIKRQADEAREEFVRIFGHSSTFSKFDWANTLEEVIEKIEGRLTKLEENNGRW